MRLPIKTTSAERQIAGVILIAALFAPSVWAVAIRATEPGAWPLAIPLVMVFALITVMTVGVRRNNPGGFTLAAGAYGFAWAAAVNLMYAAFILVTGRLPTKMHSRAVPRSSAIVEVRIAVVWSVIAVAFLALKARQRPRS